METAYLILDDGTVFKGELFGYPRNAVGELVFTTDMVGAPELLTDPSFYGQIVVQTFPMGGNHGLIPEDFLSRDVMASAYIVRE